MGKPKINRDDKFAVSFKEIRSLFKRIEQLNARWEGESCPKCNKFLLQREKALLSGDVLECPKCKQRYDFADQIVKSFLSNKKNVTSDSKRIRSEMEEIAKKYKAKISDYYGG